MAGLRRAAVVVAVVVAASLASPLAASQARSDARCTRIDLLHGAPAGGETAVRALGAALGGAAAANGLTASRLADTLTHDATARVDACGRLVFYDPAAPTTTAPRITALPASTVAGGLDPSVDVLSLESRPGSKHTLYIDVHGRSLTGTAWNSSWSLGTTYWASAWSLDADASTLSPTERAYLRDTWLAVAEDYAPFDVNVTTKDPGDAAIDRTSASDDTYGTRALLTNDSYLQSQCGCAGVAYLQAFANSYSHAYYQPALVFPSMTGGQAYNLAVVISHEVGHNVGLLHDGTTSGVEYYAYTWLRVAGALPPGLALRSDGALVGTPTASGRFTFTARISDGSRIATAGRSVTRSFTVTTAKPVVISTMRLTVVARGKSYAARVVAVGGTGSYRWARSSGWLPRGLSLSSTGRITGRAARAGTYRVVLVVRDSVGRRATHAYTIVVR